MSPRADLDRENVVQAAANLLDVEGVEALSMGRLAARLGVKTPSLYNHVDGLEGLRRELALLNARQLSARLSDAAIGKSGPPALEVVAGAYRAYINDHPGLYLFTLRASGNLEPAAEVPRTAELRAAEDQVVKVAMAIVASFGLYGEDALHAVRGLRSVVHGFATLEVAGGFGLPLDCDESFRRLVQMFIRGLQPSKEGFGE